MHIGNMGHPQSLPKKADAAVTEPVIQHALEINATKAPFECPVAVPHNPGPDSACVLTTSESQDTKVSQPAHTCACGGRKKIMTSKELGQEKEISEVLNEVNLPKNRETKFTSASSIPTETRGVDASLPRCETQRPCQCVHVNQFSRILPTGEFLARSVFLTDDNMDVSAFFVFPPPDVTGEDERMEESVDLTLHQSSLNGFEMELEDTVSRYAHNSQEFKRYLEEYQAEAVRLREDRHVKSETARQIQANAEAMFNKVKQNPGSRVSPGQYNTIRAAMAMRAKLETEVKDIDQKLRHESTVVKQLIEQSLLIDFDPAQVLADRRRRAAEFELLSAQKQWEMDMMSLCRVKQGPTTTFQKKAWEWHRVDDEEDNKPEMRTYPTGPARASRRSPSPVATARRINEEIKIPAWFQVLDSSGRVGLNGKNLEARYKSLLITLRDLQEAMRQEERLEVTKTWAKEWHDPNPGWPHPHWRERGGWWKCREGTDATQAERQCRVCHQPQEQSRGSDQRGTQRRPRPGIPSRRSTSGSSKKKAPVKKPELSSSQKYKRLVAEIERAMDQCTEKDKMDLWARMRIQRRLKEDLHQTGSSRHQGPEGENHNIKIYIMGPSVEGERRKVACYHRM